MSTPGERQAIEMGKRRSVDFECAVECTDCAQFREQAYLAENENAEFRQRECPDCAVLKARLAGAEALLREVSEWTSPALGPRIREVASEALKWLEGAGK